MESPETAGGNVHCSINVQPAVEQLGLAKMHKKKPHGCGVSTGTGTGMACRNPTVFIQARPLWVVTPLSRPALARPASHSGASAHDDGSCADFHVIHDFDFGMTPATRAHF
jgi:hypothetical protein